MTIMKATGFVSVVCAALLMTSTQAQAQAPTLTATVSGTSVTFTWTAVAGATGYRIEAGSTPGGSDVAVVNVAGGTLQYYANGWPGVYYVRVRGTAGGTLGPASNEVTITIAPPSCNTPVLNAAVSGASVTFSWNAVAGATGGQIYVGRAPGLVEQTIPVSGTATSYQATASAIATYYATLVMGGACGTLTSAETSFAVTSLASGNGPRTANPPTGQKLPLPSYGASVAQQMAQRYPSDLYNSCKEHGGTNTWLFRLVQALRQYDSRWGLNWKRGNRGDMSQDIVNYNYGSGPDDDTTEVYIIDVIGGHCGSRPSWNWQDQTQATRNAGAIGRWTLQPYLQAGYPADAR